MIAQRLPFVHCRLLREGLSLLLEREPSVQVAGDAPDQAAAKVLVRNLDADLLVFSCGRGDDVVEIVTRFTSLRPAFRIVMLLPSLAAHDVQAALVAARYRVFRAIAHRLICSPAFELRSLAKPTLRRA